MTWRRFMYAALAIVSLTLNPWLAHAAAPPKPSGQPLVSSDLRIAIFSRLDSVSQGGQVSYLIPFEVKANSTVSVSAQAPVGLIIESAPSATISGQQATWILHGGSTGAGGVLTMTAKAPVALSAQSGLSAALTASGPSGTLGQAVSGPLTVGPVLHRPFFKGYPSGKFLPARPISRAEVAAVVARIEGLVPSAPGSQRFSDVPPSVWEYPYVQAVARAGWMSGYPNHTFDPNVPITRGQLAAVLTRIIVGGPVRFGPQSTVQPTTFGDVPASLWDAADITTAAALGLLGGEPGGLFLPDAPTPRADAAKAFDAVLGRGPLYSGQTKVVQHFPDVPRSFWAFHWIEECATEGHYDLAQSNGTELLVRYDPSATVY